MEEIHKEKIQSTDKRLNRHINHDSRSKDFTFNTTGLQVIDVEHKRFIPVLDQGQVGSCTGNAGIGAINTSPFTPSVTPFYSANEAGALALYSAAETIDGDGPYPPHDNGSSGLSIAKALKNAAMISGYQHTFTLNDALKALSVYPIITGISWFEDMFNPDADGRVHPTGTLAGGHEIEGYKVDVENGRIWFYNSWGTSWGVNGTFYLTWADFHDLLAKQGDVTVLIPPTVTPPIPQPTPTSNSAILTRGIDDGVETLGSLVASRSDGQTLSEFTLELPWKNNAQNISCIPKGVYHCSIKPFHSTTQYEVLNVPGRAGIFIHVGNYYHDSMGCIILGQGKGDINHDGQTDVTSSVKAISALKKFFNNEDFTLTIQ